MMKHMISNPTIKTMIGHALFNQGQIHADLKSKSISVWGFCQVQGANIPYLTPKRLAEQLGVSVKTLERLRKSGGGPPFIKAGNKHIRYPVKGLDEWATASLKFIDIENE